MPRRLSFPQLRLSEQPLLFLAIAFTGGLRLGASWPVSLRAWVGTAVAAWLLAGVSLFSGRRGGLTASLLLAAFCCGGGLWRLHEHSIGPDHVRRLFARGELRREDPAELIGLLDGAPELAPDRMILRLALEQAGTLGRPRQASGTVQLTVALGDDDARAEYDALRLDAGSRIRALCALDDHGGYRNPGAPDFSALLEARGIDARGWAKSPLLIEPLGAAGAQPVSRWLGRLRGRAIAATLRGFRQPTSGILVASLFGNRYFLLQGPAESFRAGGTFHLLVISGSHVSLLALLAFWAAGGLSRRRGIRFGAGIALIWGYAVMVGAEPSITRAVVMLSIAVAGRLLFRRTIGTNLLAAGALLLLAWQPRDLFNPSFQLSFLTVLMIVALVVPIYQRGDRIGRWQPTSATPYPPRAPRWALAAAEILFWDERRFRAEMRASFIRYRLRKSGLAVRANRWRLQGLLAWGAATLFTTTAVQIGLLPMMIAYFHRVSPVSPIANVLESALLSLLMAAGAGALLLREMLGSLARPLLRGVDALGRWTVRAQDRLLDGAWASWRVPDWGEGSACAYGAFFLAVLLLIVCVHRWNPFRKGDAPADARRRFLGRIAAGAALLTIAVIGGLLVWHPFAPRYEPGRLMMTVLDVGQGDAILIRFPRGHTMLLDSGGRLERGHDAATASPKSEEAEDEDVMLVEDRLGIGEAAVMPFLWYCGLKRLDWIAASHPDADHVQGFAEIARGFAAGEALRGVAFRPAGPDWFGDAVRRSGAALRPVARGDVLTIDGARVEVLSPEPPADAPPLSRNNDSLVLRVAYGARRFLLPGDIEREGEARLCDSGCDLRADVLKVAHHGSKTSSTDAFLAAVRPAHAVISVADPSPFGHPHAEALARLAAAGPRLWRTSRCGAVTFSTDGADLRIETTVKCESAGRSADTASRSSPGR